MLFHVLGLITLASQGLGAAWLTHYMINACRRPHSWQQALRIPKAIYTFDYTGDDTAGLY